MYLMLLAIAALAMLGTYHFTKGKRRKGKKRGLLNSSKPMDTGTKNGPVDYSWIPEETLQVLSKLDCQLMNRKKVNRPFFWRRW